MEVVILIATVVTLGYVAVCLWYLSRMLNWSGIYKLLIQLLAMGTVGVQNLQEQAQEHKDSIGKWVAMNAGRPAELQTGESMQGLRGTASRLSRGLRQIRGLSGRAGEAQEGGTDQQRG